MSDARQLREAPLRQAEHASADVGDGSHARVIFFFELLGKKYSQGNLTPRPSLLMRDSMKDMAQKIRHARQSLGMNQAQFARALGASQGSVSKWETGKDRPSASMLSSLVSLTKYPADFFLHTSEDILRVNVDFISLTLLVGIIDGTFNEKTDFVDQTMTTFTVALPSTFPNLRVDAYAVAGERANEKFNEGDFVFAVAHSSWSAEIKDDDLVIVKRKDARGWTELSLRRYKNTGEVWLWPITDDPEYQAPVREGNRSQDPSVGEIHAIVVGSYAVHPAAHRPKE